MRGVTGWFRGRGIPPLKSLRGIPAAALFALPLLAILTTGVEAQTTRLLVGNIDNAFTASTSLSDRSVRAIAFTTGTNSDGYNVASLQVRYASQVTASHLNNLEVTIRNVSGQNPGNTVLGTFTNPSPSAAGVLTFTAPGGGIDLSASTTYFVQFAVASGGAAVSLSVRNGTNKGDEDGGSLTGWTIADAQREGFGTTWVSGSAIPQIALRGTVKTAGPAAPANLGAAPENEGVQLQWRDPSDNTITKWQYRRRDGDPGTWGAWTDLTTSKLGSTLFGTVRGLTNGTEYDFEVRAVAGSTNGTAATVSATPVPRPEAPTGLTATGGNQQVVLSWTNPNNASITGYAYQQRTPPSTGTWGNETAITPSGATTTTHTVTGLTNYTEYEFRLRAINPAGGTNSDAVSATPRPANAPGPPTNFTAVAGPGGGQVTLSWTRPSGTITRYEYRARRPGGDWFGWADIRGNNRTTFAASVGNEPLEFQMRARNGSVRGVLSVIVPATAVAAPSAPTGVTATAGNAQVTLSWGDPSNSDITKYQYRQKLSSSSTWGSWTDFTGGTTATSTSGTVTGLTNGTAYDFEVRATAATGGTVLGAASASVSATPAAVTGPAAPMGFTIDTGDTEITLKWTDPNNDAITKYQYRQGTGPVGSISWGEWTDIPASDEDTTDHTVTGLTNGTRYYFQVRAVAGTLNGAATDSSAITPVAKPAAPTGLRATAGATQVTLNWADPGNATIEKYQVRHGEGLTTDSGFSWGTWADVSSSSATTTSATVTALTNGTEYTFGVRAVGLSGDGAEATVVATPLATTAPAAPAGFTAAAGDTSGEVDLSWTDPSNSAITKWQVRYGPSPSGGNTAWGAWADIPSSGAGTASHTVAGLTGGTRYAFQVRAVATAVLGAATAAATATPTSPLPAALTLTAAAGAAQVTVSWTDPNDSSITKYELQQRAAGGAWGASVDLLASWTSITRTGLTNGTEYEFRVRAVNATGDGPWTSVFATPLATGAAAAPTSFTATAGNGQVDLAWMAPSGTITKYQVRQGTGDPVVWGAWADITGTTSHTVTGLTGGTAYSFQVRAVTGTSVFGAMSDTASATPTVPLPEVPTNVAAAAGDARVTLSWDDPMDDSITGYEYQQRVEGALWPDGWTSIANSASLTEYAVTGLTNGTTYEFHLQAVNAGGASAPSDTVSATPLASAAPAKPTGLTATAGGSSVTLSWTAPGGTITGYEIRQGTGDPVDWGAWGAISSSTSSTVSHTVSSLTVGTAYSFQIRAVNNAVKGAMSDTATATPAAATVGFKDPLLNPTENTNLTVTLVLSNTVSADVEVYLTSTALTATKGSDYAAGTVTSPDGTTGTYKVTITAGQTEGSTTIAISDDTIAEVNELFNLDIHEIASTVAIARGATTTSAVIVKDDTDTAIALPDPATLTVTEAAGGTRTGTYDVALQIQINGAETVTVAVASRDASVATVTPASLTFTAEDWSTGKTVTVTGVDDEIDQDTDRTVAIRHTATSDGMNSLYTGRDSADLIVTVTDDDVTAPGVTTTQPSDKAVDEADQTDTATFTVVLNTEPSAPVRVSLTPATGLQLSTSGTNWGTSLQLDFATGAWSTAQTVMVRAATDSVDSPSARELAVTWAATSSDTDYSGLSGTAATVTVADDDATTVTLAGAAGDVAEGGTKTFTITLNRGLVNGETLGVPLTFGGDATRNTDYTTACPDTLPTGVTCNNLNTDTTPTVTFTGPTTGATATEVTLTLTAATDNTAESGGESVVIGLGTLTATGLGGGASTADSLADFNITDPDASAPTLEISGVPKRITTRAAFTVTFTFSESVTDFVTGDVTVTNGDKSSFTGSGSSYTVVVTPNADADVTVTVDADSATDGTNTGPTADVVATAVFGAPAAPTVTATAGNGQVTLSWTDPSDDTITGYEYQQREEGGTWPNSWTDIANSASLTEYAVTSLTNGTTYEFRVRAVSGTVTSPASSVVTATPLAATAPGPPRDLRAAPGSGQVVLNWRVPGTNAGAITKYQVRQGTGDPVVWGAWADITGTTSHTVAGLTNGTEYSFQVRAVATAVLGAASDTVEATPNPIPAAPTNFMATKGTASGAIALSWTAPSGTITRYEYRLRPVGGDWPQSWTRLNVPGVTSFTVGSQTDGTEYEIELRAVNDSGAGAAASATATPLDPTAAAAPTSFTATAGSGQVDLAWTAPSGTITKYQVRQGTGDPVMWGAWADITGTTSHTVTSLTNGTEYSFQVRAVTGTATFGAMSATAMATPTAAPGVTISVTDATVSEADRTDRATFTVVLNTRPSADVTLTIYAPVGLEIDGPDNDSDFARTETATFSTTNWSTAQTVTVRASSEPTDHPSSREEVIGYFTTSSDTDYLITRGVGPTVTVVDNDPTTVTLAGAAGDVAEGATKTFTVTLGRGLVDGETLGVPLTFGGDATRGTDYMTACPTTLPTGVTCNDLDDTSLTPTVTFTGPSTGATARTVTLTLSATSDNTTEAGGESVVIGFGTLTATGLEGGTSTTDNLADFKITDPDASVPTVAITGIPAKINNTNALTATFTFSEAVTGFVKADITVTGGTAGTFSATSTTVYTLGITPDGDANVVVTVAADAATDGTNTGPASAESATAVWDETAPTVEITGVPGKISNRDAFTVTFSFSESVTGFDTDDVSVTNGDKSVFSGSGSSYTVVVTPNADADVTVTVAANSATDGTNMGPSADVVATAVWDETAPTVDITGIPAKINNTNALTATFTFSETVTGFAKSDITVTGGTAGAFGGSGTTYTLAITPTSGSNVVVTVAANSATDGTNMGPATAESATATWDASVPTVSITGVPARIRGTSDLTATFTFGEAVTDFDTSDVTVTGGTKGTFTESSSTVYTLVITPGGNANVVVTVAADSATDGLNTGPASAETATAVWTALVFNPAAVTVVEEASATYTVELSSQPDGNVTVTVAGASGEVTFDTDSAMPGTQTTALTFTTTNWSTGQTVTVLAAADGDTANDSATLTHTASGGGYGSVTGDVEVTVTDNDTPGLVLDPTALTVAEGGSGTYTVALATEPTASVTVTVAGASGEVTVDTDSTANGNQNTLTFTTSDWGTAQTVTVSAGQDNDADDDSATLTHSASGGGYGSVSGDVAVTVTDDDTAGVVTTEPDATATEGSTTDTATFTVALNTRPSSDVTVTVTAPTGLTLDGPDSATAFTASEGLTFTSTNWSTAQTVTVRATDDNDDSPIGRELTVTYAAASSDSGYSGLSGDAATVTVVDNDPTTVTLAGAAGDVVEGGTKTFTITLNRGLVNGETLGVPLTFGGDATRGTDYTTACPDTLPTGVTCNDLNTDTTPTVTFTGPSTGTTATTVTLTLTAATDNTAESGGESVVIGLGTLTATGLGGGASTADNLADFDITDPDASAPTLEISGVPKRITTRAAFTVTFTFSEAVTDFVKNDITVTGGTAGTFSATSTTVYTLGITPDGDANVVVTVAADSATDGTNTGPPADVVATAVFGAPAAPSVTATAGNAAVTLRWTDPRDDTITGYEFRQGVQSSPVTWGSWTPITNSDKGTTSHTVTGLTDGTEYYFQVRAVSDAVMGEPSAEENPDAVVTPLAMNAPAAPMGLTATAGDTEVDLNWIAPGGTFTGYQVQQGTGDPVVWGAWTALSGTGTSHTVTGLTNGTAYSFRVRAVNSAVLGAATDPATATPRGAAGVTTTQPVDRQVTEGDTADTATFTVELDTPPSSDVTLTVTAVAGLELDGPDPGGTFGSSEALTFTSGNWSTAQTVTVRATDDSVDRPSGGELPVSYLTASSDSDYNSLLGAAAVVTVTDNDPTAVTLAGAAGDITEGGTKDFTVTLGVRGLVSGETLPVPLAFTGGATRGTDYTVACPTSLPTGVTCNDLNMAATPTVTFTGPSTGETERTVTLTLSAATDNTAESGGETVVIGLGTLTATGLEGGASGTDSLADFRINDPDANAPTVAISVPARISNTNALTAMFTFSEPVTGFTTDDVAVAGGAKGTFTATSPRVYTLGITPSGGANVVVTVAANAASDGTNTGPASAQTATALWAALVFNPTSVTVVEESTATYTVELSSQPDGNVTVAVAGASGEVAFDTDSDTPGTQTTDLTFTTTNWDDARTVTVLAAADNDTADDSATLTHTASGGGYGSVSGSVEVTVTDNDTAGPVLDPTAPPVAEGDVVVAPPPGPTIAASDITDTGATLTATNVPGGVWRHRRTLPEGGECSGPQSGESAVLAGLMAATEYAYGLYADSACANELASVGFTTPAPPPSIAATGVTDTGATLTAANVPGGVWRYRRTLPEGGECSGPQSGESAALAGLMAATEYAYGLYSDSACANELASVEFTTPAPPPSIAATGVTDTGATLTAANVPGGVWRHRRTLPEGGECSGPQSGESAALAGLMAATEYAYGLYADSACANELASVGFTTGPSTNAALAGLALATRAGGAAALAPAFSPEADAYSASLPFAADSALLTPRTAHPDATARVGPRGGPLAAVPAQGEGAAVPLSVGVNEIVVEVTAADGATKRTVTLSITRAAPGPLDGTAATSHLFPLFADGGGFRSRLLVAHAAGGRARCELALHGAGLDAVRFSAEPMSALPPAAEPESEAAGIGIRLAAGGGGVALNSAGAGELAFGHAKLDCDGPVSAQLLLSLEAGGALSAMAHQSPAERGRAFSLPGLPAPLRLGLAFANDGVRGNLCVVEAAEGRGVVAVPPGGTAFRLLDEIVPSAGGDGGTGPVAVRCDRPAALLAVPLAGGAFTTLAPAVLDADGAADGSAGRRSLLPLALDGGGFRSRLAAVNLAAGANRCELRLSAAGGLAGANFGAAADGPEGMDGFALALAGRGAQESLDSRGGEAFAFGHAALECEGPAALWNLIVLEGPDGPAGMMALGPAQPAREMRFRAPPAPARLGLAIANGGGARTACHVALAAADGRAAPPAGFPLISVPARATAIRFLDEMFAVPADFAGGAATLRCDHPVGAVAVPVAGAAFTAVPPIIPGLETAPEATVDSGGDTPGGSQ